MLVAEACDMHTELGKAATQYFVAFKLPRTILQSAITQS